MYAAAFFAVLVGWYATGMFGLINLHGIPKPTYRAYQLLHETGRERLQVVSMPCRAGVNFKAAP